ncbi:MAG: RidA family protein [Bacteroidota bacterium]
MNLQERVKQLNLELPPPPPPAGVYKPVVVIDNMLYVSGQGPMRSDGSLITGRLGDDMRLDQGYDAARQVGLTMLSTINTHYDLSKVKRIVKTLGMVNCTPDFPNHPKVINGFSELFGELLGPDLGVGARSAVGMMLPFGVAVEIEAIFEIHQ